jgi:hypothetical protein
VSLVVSVVAAPVEVRLRGIDTMWRRRSCSRWLGQRVVCFVVLVVMAGAEVATGSVLVHPNLRRWRFLAAERSL